MLVFDAYPFFISDGSYRYRPKADLETESQIQLG